MDWLRSELAGLPDGVIAIGLHSETKHPIQLVMEGGLLRLEASSGDDPMLCDGLRILPFRHTHTHYKGGRYEVLADALPFGAERLVVYRREAGDVWFRPRQMFFEVMGDGRPRFAPQA